MRHPSPCAWRVIPVLAIPLLICAPAHAQEIRYEGKAVTLQQVVTELERQTGYEFIIQDPGKEAETARREVTLKNVSLASALTALAELYKCDFFSLEPSGFRVIPPSKPEGKEIEVGPLRLRTTPPYPAVEPSPMTVQVSLLFTGPEEQVERIARLGPDIRVLDNFGRSMLPDSTAVLRGTSAPRVKLGEYRQRLHLTLPDERSVRVRTLAGSLQLFRKITPVRVEFPLQGEETSGSDSREGVQVRLESARWNGSDLRGSTRVSWPESIDVVGRGISRNEIPYVVDEKGRVYRSFAPRYTRSREAGTRVLEQSFHFEDLEARPVKIGYELWVKEDPSDALPFRLNNLALPEPAEPAIRPEQRPFFAAEGGAVTLKVLDRAGKAIEGEVTLGVARKSATGASAWRWIEVITQPDGTVKLDHLQPGVYRITRLFRAAPGSKALTDQRGPIEVTVVAKKDVALPVLKVPIASPQD
jgi:hypothetical protein